MNFLRFTFDDSYIPKIIKCLEKLKLSNKCMEHLTREYILDVCEHEWFDNPTEATNFHCALKFVDDYVKRASKQDIGFLIDYDTICGWHKIALRHDPEKRPGFIRRQGVGQVYSLDHMFPDSAIIPQMFQQYIDIFNEISHVLKNVTCQIDKLLCTIKFAAFALQSFNAIHAFTDGNGRTARLLCHFVLSSVIPFPILLGFILSDLIKGEGQNDNLLTTLKPCFLASTICRAILACCEKLLMTG